MTERHAPKTVRVGSGDGTLTVSRRTYRSADFVHILFGVLATVMGLLFLWIAVDNGTLLDGVATPIVIALLLAYGYFALTRITNWRTVRIADGRIIAKDGPLPQFVRTLNMDVDDYGDVEARSAKRLTFPAIQTYTLWYVGAESQVDLFRRLHDEEEARYIQSVISDALGSSSVRD